MQHHYTSSMSSVAHFHWSQVVHPVQVHCQSACFFFVGSTAEQKVNLWSVRHHFTAAVSGLTVSDVNFNFSFFGHNHGFCFLQVWCPTVFASSGQYVLLKFGPQDTLSYKVLKHKCNTVRGSLLMRRKYLACLFQLHIYAKHIVRF